MKRRDFMASFLALAAPELTMPIQASTRVEPIAEPSQKMLPIPIIYGEPRAGDIVTFGGSPQKWMIGPTYRHT